jgi:hypothetical protein
VFPSYHGGVTSFDQLTISHLHTQLYLLFIGFVSHLVEVRKIYSLVLLKVTLWSPFPSLNLLPRKFVSCVVLLRHVLKDHLDRVPQDLKFVSEGERTLKEGRGSLLPWLANITIHHPNQEIIYLSRLRGPRLIVPGIYVFVRITRRSPLWKLIPWKWFFITSWRVGVLDHSNYKLISTRRNGIQKFFSLRI